jgi:hypothetical protein
MNKKEEAKRTKYYSNDMIMPPECDALCRFRHCYQKYENKGTFTVGRGYTSYHDGFRPVCGVRQLHGCGDERKTYDKKKALEYCVDKLSLPGGAAFKVKQKLHVISILEQMLLLEKEG